MEEIEEEKQERKQEKRAKLLAQLAKLDGDEDEQSEDKGRSDHEKGVALRKQQGTRTKTTLKASKEALEKKEQQMIH